MSYHHSESLLGCSVEIPIDLHNHIQSTGAIMNEDDEEVEDAVEIIDPIQALRNALGELLGEIEVFSNTEHPDQMSLARVMARTRGVYNRTAP